MEQADREASMARFFASVLMAVGGLIAGLCGACTLFWGGASLVDIATGNQGGFGPIVLMSALIFGVLPTFVGVLIFRAGLRRYRAAGPKP